MGWTTGILFPAKATGYRVHTSYGTHPASYLMGTLVHSPEIKRPGRGVVPPLLHTSS